MLDKPFSERCFNDFALLQSVIWVGFHRDQDGFVKLLANLDSKVNAKSAHHQPLVCTNWISLLHHKPVSLMESRKQGVKDQRTACLNT